MILDHYQRFGGDGERFSAVECCGTDEYLYPGLVGKKLFSCTIFANISIWEAVLLQIKFIKKCIGVLAGRVAGRRYCARRGRVRGCIDMLWQLRVPQMEMKCQ
ncbi:TPA: hypothetical protein ACNS9M_000433 [Escherichia coli]|uniref:hypothetical protein n=1 Tax=Escherichia coli TaxID=562 RepID=UPI001879E39E|nr:hypothetical protein [Escherichia coli]EJE7039858.1 hypothetical protein [Escherichia coli]ELR0768141.1 hypothetical protein [Escherichia coli]